MQKVSSSVRIVIRSSSKGKNSDNSKDLFYRPWFRAHSIPRTRRLASGWWEKKNWEELGDDTQLFFPLLFFFYLLPLFRTTPFPHFVFPFSLFIPPCFSFTVSQTSPFGRARNFKKFRFWGCVLWFLWSVTFIKLLFFPLLWSMLSLFTVFGFLGWNEVFPCMSKMCDLCFFKTALHLGFLGFVGFWDHWEWWM